MVFWFLSAFVFLSEELEEVLSGQTSFVQVSRCSLYMEIKTEYYSLFSTIMEVFCFNVICTEDLLILCCCLKRIIVIESKF